VTWRLANNAAGPGYFLASDAALVLDRTSSCGVLCALMSGKMAAHLSAQVCRDELGEGIRSDGLRKLGARVV
jgi:flavin-dependent dehydrogenase